MIQKAIIEGLQYMPSSDGSFKIFWFNGLRLIHQPFISLLFHNDRSYNRRPDCELSTADYDQPIDILDKRVPD